MKAVQLNRRDFLKYSGFGASGLLLGCATAKTNMLTSALQGAAAVDTTPDALNIFVSIGSDNKIHLIN